ncbi:MAG: hypothetical protein LM590_14050 [Thermofilum sp.]|nr:hypothetical protein [Thermofilum sp.]
MIDGMLNRRRKRRIQLQTHKDALKKALKQLNKCIEKIDDPTFQLEVDIPLEDILRKIFPEETIYLTEILRETCNTMKTQLDELKENYKIRIMSIFKSIYKSELIPFETMYEETVVKTPSYSMSQPFERAMGALLSMLVEVSGVFSRRSFEAAYLTAEVLGNKLRQTDNVNITESDLRDMDMRCIHPTWSLLADKGCSLLAKIQGRLNDETIMKMINALSSMGSSLKNQAKELHNLIFAEELQKKKLNAVIFKELNSLENLLENFDKHILVDYIFEHLQALRTTLIGSGRVPLPRELEYYLKVVFEDSCFLEYEVYAALLEHGIAALPRVPLEYSREVQSEGEHERKERVPTDIDVVATLGDDLWLVEVTKSEREDKLKRDVKDLEFLVRELEAEGALVVCTRAAREKAEKDIKTEKLLFIAFEDIFSELHRLFME